MAERLADIVTKITSVRQLDQVVTAMRSIAAARAQQARGLAPGMRAYSAAIAQAMGEALSLAAKNEAPASDASLHEGRILFCAEQGFAGAFSERILDAAFAVKEADIPATSVFIIGTRGATIATEHGIQFGWSAPMASHAGAIADVARRIADALYDAVASGRMTKVELFFPFSGAGKGIEIRRRSLLPLDLTRFQLPANNNLPPLTTLDPRELLADLALEYVFAELCDAAMQAFVAENEARMMTMSAAKTNIAQKLSELSRQEQQVRQEEITTEIVELATGAEALRAR